MGGVRSHPTTLLEASVMRLAQALFPIIAVVAGLALPRPGSAEALVNIAGSRFGTLVRADTEYGPAYSGANAADGRIARGEACWFSGDYTKLPCALTFELPQAEDLRQVVLY